MFQKRLLHTQNKQSQIHSSCSFSEVVHCAPLKSRLPVFSDEMGSFKKREHRETWKNCVRLKWEQSILSSFCNYLDLFLSFGFINQLLLACTVNLSVQGHTLIRWISLKGPNQEVALIRTAQLRPQRWMEDPQCLLYGLLCNKRQTWTLSCAVIMIQVRGVCTEKCHLIWNEQAAIKDAPSGGICEQSYVTRRSSVAKRKRCLDAVSIAEFSGVSLLFVRFWLTDALVGSLRNEPKI